MFNKRAVSLWCFLTIQLRSVAILTGFWASLQSPKYTHLLCAVWRYLRTPASRTLRETEKDRNVDKGRMI